MELEVPEAEGSKSDAVPAGKPRRKRNHAGWGRLIKQVLACVVLAGLAYGCFQLSQRYVLQSVQVAGPSMSPTLPDSNRYLLNRLVYLFREPKPEDIVVLQDPEDKGYAIKRIVAKPGDSVYVNAGQIFVNGKLLKEPYLSPDTKTYASPKYSAQFWICGAHQYFVLGDNRNNSTDSRIYGAVPQQNILGMVFP
jgi:signal peptidase I